MAINQLRCVSVFIQAAELGSLRKAALALDISPQAASKALAQLEVHLDCWRRPKTEPLLRVVPTQN